MPNVIFNITESKKKTRQYGLLFIIAGFGFLLVWYLMEQFNGIFPRYSW